MRKINWVRSVILLTLLGFYVSIAPGVPIQEKGLTFYIAPNGNNTWSGSLKSPNSSKTDGPFASLAAAQKAIRNLKARGRFTQPVTVYLRGGLYVLDTPLVFTPDDSGTKQNPITLAAYPNEIPVISGGRSISGLTPKEGNIWAAEVPQSKEGRWVFHQLFINGERRQRARTPNTGFANMIGEISTEPQARFQYKNGDIRKDWADRGDVEVVGLAKWIEFRLPIAAVDEQTQKVVLAGKVPEHTREKDGRYWVENLREGLDQPGEWFLDRRTGLLSYIPLPNEKPGSVEAVAPFLQQLIRLEGRPEEGKYVEYLHFQGLTFRYTDWSLPPKGYTDMQAAYDIPAAFHAVGALSCTVAQCRFNHLGNYAIEFGRGCKENRIIGNEMFDLGAGGVKIGEGPIRKNEAEQTAGNLISDNHIHDIGIVYPAAVGVWIGQSGNNTVAHNHIHNTYYTGISVGWTWGYGETNAHHNRIEFNHVHDIGRGLLSDMGGIYTLGVQPGTVIRNNLFHDINSYDYGGWGIYTDEGSTNILIENNVVYRTKSSGFHQHYGRENIIRNNIFAFGKEHQLMRSRMEPHLSFTFEHNIVFWNEGDLLGSSWTDDQYKMDYNVYWDTRKTPIRFAKWSWEEWLKRGQDVHSLIVDPLFLKPDQFDFTLRRNSPALKMGFKPIDLRGVGPRSSNYLRNKLSSES